MPDIRSFYVTVLSQELSPCEEFLAAGTNYGNINIFNLNRFYSGNNELGLDVEQRKPWKNFPVSSKPIQGMASSTEHLIVGGKNQLYGYSWNQLKTKGACKETKPSWTINLNIPTDFGSKETIDYITLDENGTIFVACGDNCIRAVDMEYGKVTSVFSGHEDLIHSMSNFGSQLSSASEDGTVCLWDTKRAKCVHTLVPHLEAKLSRPNLGKWLGAVALNEDWLLCGGGPHLALYHLRSLTMSCVLLQNEPLGVNSVIMNNDSIVVAMDGPFVYQVLFSGDITSKTPTTPLRVYSLALQKGEKKLLTVGGASAGIDICLNSKLQDQVAWCTS